MVRVQSSKEALHRLTKYMPLFFRLSLAVWNPPRACAHFTGSCSSGQLRAETDTRVRRRRNRRRLPARGCRSSGEGARGRDVAGIKCSNLSSH